MSLPEGAERGKASTRVYCRSCGIVRDISDFDAAREGLPWCRHNALDQPAGRMILIPAYHPLATGALPWAGDPST